MGRTTLSRVQGVRSYQEQEYWRRSFRSRWARTRSSGQQADAFLDAANIRVNRVEDTVDSRWKVAQLADITLVHATGPEAEVVLAGTPARAEQAMIVFTHVGDVRLSGPDMVSRCPDLVVIPPSAEDLTFTCHAPMNEWITATVPANLIAGIPLPTTYSAEPCKAASGHSIPDAIFQMLRSMIHQPVAEVGDRSARLAVSDALRMLLHMLAPIPDRDLTLYERALHVIETNLSNSALNAEFIAASVGVSIRRLQSEFRDRQTTLPREIRRMRVAAYRSARTGNPQASVNGLARSVGFASKSTLYRALSEFSEHDEEATA